MSDEIAEGALATLEELAKTSVVASVIWYLFLVVSWPFVSISRLAFLALTFGKVRPDYRESLDHPGIMALALLIFVPTLFYLHLVVGARLYGNLSG